MTLKWVRKYVQVSDVPFIADRAIREMDIGDCLIKETDGSAIAVTDSSRRTAAGNVIVDIIAEANRIGQRWIVATHDERGKWQHRHGLSKSEAVEALAQEAKRHSITKWEAMGTLTS